MVGVNYYRKRPTPYALRYNINTYAKASRRIIILLIFIDLNIRRREKKKKEMIQIINTKFLVLRVGSFGSIK